MIINFDVAGLPFKRVKRGETLYRPGTPLDSVYVVRSGFFKSQLMNEQGRAHVTAFHLQNDLMGLDGVAMGEHHLEVVALEDSMVTIVPREKFERFGVHRAVGLEMARSHRMMMWLGTLKADERFASFLADMSERLLACGYSSREFHLRMTRHEIASFLGLSFETVSRLFSAFHQKGLLAVDNRHVKILDMAALQAMIGARSVEPAVRAA
jgi:CRP/FNR family transcriptional regulator, anaerobic regulatory protein